MPDPAHLRATSRCPAWCDRLHLQEADRDDGPVHHDSPVHHVQTGRGPTAYLLASVTERSGDDSALVVLSDDRGVVAHLDLEELNRLVQTLTNCGLDLR